MLMLKDKHSHIVFLWSVTQCIAKPACFQITEPQLSSSNVGLISNTIVKISEESTILPLTDV